jgi:phosphosulfolactate synthase (CoM biosynthesis protein A)
MGYDKNGNIEISNPCVFFSNKKDSKIIEAPEQEILQKWLREYHDIDVHVYKDDINYMTKYSNKKYPEYTLALEEGLYEALKLI